MKIEKKLVAYSAIALMIGVASIAPLLFLMSGTAKAETTPKPWFNINVPYAYWTANLTENLNGRDVYNQWHSIVLNFTLNPEAENEISDAQFEYYELQMYTDKEPIENMSYFVGTNRTNSFKFEAESFHFMRDDWFDSNTTSGGMFAYNWNMSGSADISAISGCRSGSGPTGHFKPPQTVTALREAEIMYIDVRRIGLVTFNGNSTVVTVSDKEVIQHIQLKKFADGFLYNALFPEDKLSEIDLTAPLKSLAQLKP